ncbi:hypothetical protein V8E51_014177 [Hyaloscypha variabilis]
MSLVALLTVLIFCFGISTNAQDVKSLWFAPGVPITRFQATVTVPSLPSGGGAHGIWPGVENDGAGFVFQAVISDSKSPGAWEFWVEFCCNPNYEASPIKVYPGDSITSTFTLGPAGWTDSWSLSPGSTGRSSGQNSQSGSSSNTFAGTISKALLAIELQDGAAWTFGKVQWGGVAVQAETSSAWCSNK